MTCLDEQHPRRSGTEQMIMSSYTSDVVYRNIWSDRADMVYKNTWSDRAHDAMHEHMTWYT